MYESNLAKYLLCFVNHDKINLLESIICKSSFALRFKELLIISQEFT